MNKIGLLLCLVVPFAAARADTLQNPDHLCTSVPTMNVATDKVALLVSHRAYKALKPYIQQYKVEVEARFPVQLHMVEGAWGNPAEVRATIKSLHAKDGIAGVILVGAMPMHHFFMHEHANPNPLYYEDFNLEFADNNKDGVDDAYQGKPELKVWVANIRACEKVREDDIPGLRRFFAKTHDYYTGKAVPELRTLLFSTEIRTPDWAGTGDWFKRHGGTRFSAPGDVTMLEGKACTHKAALEAFKKHSYTLTYVGLHSDDTGHAMADEDLFAREIAEMRTGSLITINHGCFTANWTKTEQENNGPNCAMSWVFGKHLGQAVIAQVRSGGIGGDDLIYARLRAGDYLGKAYLPCKQAHEIEASPGDHTPGDIVSGILMIGNPFLTLKPVKHETTDRPRLVIRNAVYGDLANHAVVNVTQKVADWVEDSLPVEATADNFGDPANGIEKQLRVDYTLDGVDASETVDENQTLKIKRYGPSKGNWDSVAEQFVCPEKGTLLRSGHLGPCSGTGDPQFDSDSVASSELQQRRWLSYPGGRLCLNPATRHKFELAPMSADLALNIGGYVGTGVLRLDNLVEVHVENELSTTRRTTWFPYQIAFEASYPSGVALTGHDFFIDADSTLIRLLKLHRAAGKSVALSGKISGAKGARWDGARRAVVVEDPNWSYALCIAADASCTLSGGSWSIAIPVKTNDAELAIAFGFAAGCEGADTAIKRASSALAQPVTKSLATAKANMDGYLRRVPKPAAWGITGIPALGVTPERHRQAYYAAWSLLVQSIMNPFPENLEYPFPQMSLGKPSLWAEGERTSPATCGWESFLGLQWFSFLEPETCWQAYTGILSRVDDDGKLGGESLPSRKAQTAWILFKQRPDRDRLAAVYPALKRYLLWREQNPRWIYGGNNARDEKDIEFAVSWLFDVEYAGKIAAELGLAGDVRQWQDKAVQMRGNLDAWFFRDPAKLHQFYFAEKKVHYTKERDSDRPIMILTALWLRDLPVEAQARLVSLFREIHRPERAADGFAYTKYADNNLVAYGLIQHGLPEAKPFVEVFVRDSIRAGEFAEVLRPGKNGAPEPDGVQPSLFNALNIVEFTWLSNGVRYESGTPVGFDFPRPRN